MRIDRARLQLALDTMQLDRALQIASEAVGGGVDWLEAGTPLIKSAGTEAIRELKRRFPKCKVVADMKTMDTGALEVEIASKAGADIVTVMAAADDDTIKDAVRAARNYNAEVMADLLGMKDPVGRAKEIESFGVDYICLHVGIDQQMVGGTPVDLVGEIAAAVNIPVAAAGGLNSETVAGVIERGVKVCIVGGAITKAENVTEAAAVIKRAMDDVKVIESELFKKYGAEQLREAFMKVSTSNISDAMHRKGAMEGIRPIIPLGTKVVGQAVTVQTIDGDWAKPVEAIDEARGGDVLVIDVNGGRTAVWGELASHSCVVKGISGVVIDGASRDIEQIRKLGFPLFVRHAVPNAGEPKGHGEIGGEITCGGRTVRPGDWIIGDESGVVVVPRERAVEIANRALDVMEIENRLREEIKRGSTLSSVLDLLRWEKVG